MTEIASAGSAAARHEQTIAALKSGVDVIYQAVLVGVPWHGYADFLRRAEKPSALGPFSYEVLDTKLARTASPKHVVQLGVYCELLGRLQDCVPDEMHLVLGDDS
ncbi:MAG: hypothetical protein QF578_23780, partial [Alphaproteobacteria bacterium]|nr:hypothetical protein [Alphaproteobacteria bacterium]